MSISAKKLTRKILTLIPAAGATLTVGIMAFVGASVATLSAPLCFVAAALAVGWEAQINYEGISITIKRLLDADYTQHQVLEKYILQDPDLQIRRDCKQHKKYIRDLSEEISHLREQLYLFMPLHQGAFLIRHILGLKTKKKLAKKQLRATLLQWKAEKDRNDPLVTHIEAEINSRKHWLALGWIVSIAAGISTGFATLGSLTGSLGATAIILPVLGAIPPAALVIASILAGVGYTYLMYQTISDMLHDTSHVWKKLFERQPRMGEHGRKYESNLQYGLRFTGTAFAIVLAICATITTGGSFWYAMKDGTHFMHFPARIAGILRAITIPLMAIPTFVFNSQNSVESVNKISKTPFRKMLEEVKDDFINTQGNPFLILERILYHTTQQLMLLLHSVSIGLIGDRMPGVPPWFSIGSGGGIEYLTDYNYKPKDTSNNPVHSHAHAGHDHNEEDLDDEHEHHHHHESFLLTALFLPFHAARVVLKGLGATGNFCTRQIHQRLASGPQPPAKSLSDCFREVFKQPEPHFHNPHSPQYGSLFWKNNTTPPDHEPHHDHHSAEQAAIMTSRNP